MLVVLSLADGLWRVPERVFRPVMTVTCVFGAADGLNAAGIGLGVTTRFFQSLPLADVTMGWVLPAAITLLIAASADRLRGHPSAGV
jgi:LIVCS family branched-chain amino acid:cation transporter